jgi:Tol biopolymer transport system component
MFVDVHGLKISPTGDRPPAVGRIVVVNLVSGRRRVIGRGERPTWSPDGKRVAFFRYAYSKEHTWSIVGTRLLTMRSDGSDVRVIAVGPGEPYAFFAPQWSPDGQTIAAWGTLVDSQTGIARPLTGHVFLGAAEWSPDGSSVAFIADTSDSDLVGIMDVATGAVRTIVRTDPDIGRSMTVRWSPNGQQLGLMRCSYSPNYVCFVYTVNADGSHLRRLVQVPAVDDDFDWGRS